MKAGSGAPTLGLPDSAGVPAAHRASTRSRSRSTIRRRCEARLRRARRARSPRVIVEPVVGNMGVRRRPTRASSQALREITHAARRAAHLRRGHDRLPRRVRRRAGALRHRRPTSPASARSSAAACPSAPTAAAPTSWTRSRPAARSTRPARSPAIRSPWPPASRPSRPRTGSTRRSRREARGSRRACQRPGAERIPQSRRFHDYDLLHCGRLPTTHRQARQHPLRGILPLDARSRLLLCPPQFEAAFVSSSRTAIPGIRTAIGPLVAKPRPATAPSSGTTKRGAPGR